MFEMALWTRLKAGQSFEDTITCGSVQKLKARKSGGEPKFAGVVLELNEMPTSE